MSLADRKMHTGRLVPVIVAAPLVAAALFMAAVALSGATGAGPFRPDPPRNLSEALALSDAATAVWMFRSGADPVAAHEVRPGMIASELDRHVRPLAAAAYTSDDYMVRLAQRYGATLPPAEAHDAACWLAGKGREGVAQMISPPDWTPAVCGTGVEPR